MDLSAAAHRLAVTVLHRGLSFISTVLFTMTILHWSPHIVGLLFITRLALAISFSITPRHNAMSSGSISLLSNGLSRRTYNAKTLLFMFPIFFYQSCRIFFMLPILCDQLCHMLPKLYLSRRKYNASQSRRTYNTSFSSCTVQLCTLAILCSQASAVSMAGLPLWPSTEGPSYFPVFLNAIGAFLTIQLGCSFFHVTNASDLPVEYIDSLDNCADSPAFKKLMTTARAILTIALTPHRYMTNLASSRKLSVMLFYAYMNIQLETANPKYYGTFKE